MKLLKKNVRHFKGLNEYLDYYENHEQRDYVTDVVESECKVSADAEYECKSWRTAVRRFFKAIACDSRFDGWEEAIIESIENGEWNYFETIDGKVIPNTPHWQVEEFEDSDGVYAVYIELTVPKEF